MARRVKAVDCSVAGCENQNNTRITKGMCVTHYKRFTRKGHIELDPVTYVCGVVDCGRPHSSRGYCMQHARRDRVYGSPLEDQPIVEHVFTSEERWYKSTKEAHSGCLEWIGSMDGNGYGQIRHDGRIMAAHRYALNREGVETPKGMLVDHLCHNPVCVNKAHLRVVTPKQNGEHRQGPSKRSTSGVLGVYWNKANSNWTVRVGHNGKCGYYGSFKDKEEAEAVAIRTRNELFTHNDLDRK